MLATIAYGGRDSWASAMRLFVWALGLMIVGMFIGFLFGLPRVTPSGAAPPAANNGVPGAAAPNAPAPATHGTDAMLEIADWLAKIIAGLGLVNLKEAPSLMERLATAISCPRTAAGGCCSWWLFPFPVHHSANACDHSLGLAIGVFFPVVGLILGYLVTRLYLQTALVNSDRTTRDAVNAPLAIPQLMLKYHQGEAAAQAVAAGRTLPDEGPDPDAKTASELAALNAQYIAVAIPDYDARVRRKDELAKQMYDLAVQRQVPKGWLASQSGDGYIHVLATSVLANAVAKDVGGLLRVAPRARMKHTKFRVAQAFQKLLETQLAGADDFPLMQTVLKDYLVDADGPLRSLIELVRAKLA